MKTLKHLALGACLYTGANNNAHYLNAGNVGLLVMAYYHNPKVISEVLHTNAIVSAVATAAYTIANRDDNRNLYEIYTLIFSAAPIGAAMSLAYQEKLGILILPLVGMVCYLARGSYLQHITTYSAIKYGQIATATVLLSSLFADYMRAVYHLEN